MYTNISLAERIRSVYIISGAIMAANLVFVAVGVALVHFGAVSTWEGGNEALLCLQVSLLAAAVAVTVASFLVRRFLESRPLTPGKETERLIQTVMVPMAMSEAAGMMGLVYVLITGRIVLASLMWGLAVGAGILHFPSRARIETLLEQSGPDAGT